MTVVNPPTIGAEAIETSMLKALAVTGTKIATNSINSAKIVDASITDADLLSPVIVGVIKADGTIEAGTGFASEKTAAGTYKITLTTELASQGSLTLTPIGAGAGTLFADIEAATKKIFVIRWAAAGAVLTDTPFMFQVKAT